MLYLRPKAMHPCTCGGYGFIWVKICVKSRVSLSRGETEDETSATDKFLRKAFHCYSCMDKDKMFHGAGVGERKLCRWRRKETHPERGKTPREKHEVGERNVHFYLSFSVPLALRLIIFSAARRASRSREIKGGTRDSFLALCQVNWCLKFGSSAPCG